MFVLTQGRILQTMYRELRDSQYGKALNNVLPNNVPVQVGKHCLLFSGLGVLLRRLPNNPLTADTEISFEYLP